MSKHDSEDSAASDAESSSNSDSQQQSKRNEKSSSNNTTPKSNKKKSAKATKPRLTAVQKNTNHKDAENKRRNAIRERFTDLSHMVPGAEGQERSEQIMLGKTTEFLRQMLREQRQLEALADSQGVSIGDEGRLKDSDFGGPKWKETHMDEYRAQKVKKTGANDEDDDE